MAVKTPKYWEKKERFGELIEATTFYGNKVKIPEKFKNGWEMAQLMAEDKQKRGLDPTGGLEINKEINPLYYDLERVYYEIYQEED